MFLISIAFLALNPGMSSTSLTCPVMGEAVSKNSSYVDYNGVRYAFCCNGCDTAFAANPDKYIKSEANSKKTLGWFQFDPVTRLAITPDKAKAETDYKGVRYFFSHPDNKVAFDKDPAKFGTIPSKRSLTCPVMNSEIKSEGTAFSYADYNGVRYFFCCGGCPTPFAGNPSMYALKVANKVGVSNPISVKPKSGEKIKGAGSTQTYKSEQS